MLQLIFLHPFIYEDWLSVSLSKFKITWKYIWSRFLTNKSLNNSLDIWETWYETCLKLWAQNNLLIQSKKNENK